MEQTICGGPPVNTDYRVTSLKDGKYLLTHEASDYAVPRDAAEKFVKDVLSKCGEKHRGFFPLEPSLNGKEMAAVVETREAGQVDTYYHDMDEEILYQMLEELRAVCGEPLNQRDRINYCYPNPNLPEDFELSSIHHQVYPGPDPVPDPAFGTIRPDVMLSAFYFSNQNACLVIREGDSENSYSVPSDLLPWIKEQVRELCKDPKEAYVEVGEWEGFIRFDQEHERIFTDPERTLALLKEIAVKSTCLSSAAIDKSRCLSCGALRTSKTMKFCTECGSKFEP